jgi:8-amino-7-oxononanoate synthase
MKNLQQDLQQRKQQGLYRKRKILNSPQGREIILDDQRVLNFCSNDYLGLANHPDVIQAFRLAAQQYGVGSGAAHLVNGHTKAHHALEEELAAFCGYPRALLFSTGYMANLGVAQSLCTKHDNIIEDKLNHASLIDAANISNARLQRFLHKDYNSLQTKLARCESGEKLVSSDSVFSMDGDEADIQKMLQHCQDHDARLMLDDAHGFGVLGKQGRGSLSHQNINVDDVQIYMATLGKALGTAGAFIAGSEELVESLIQNARCYIYTTAMPAAIAEATRISLQLLLKESWRQQALTKNIEYFKLLSAQGGVNLHGSNTAIQPVIIGDASHAIGVSEKLLERGLHVAAIRPPTVPANTSRLRITLRADHTKEDIEYLLEEICRAVVN